MLEVVKRGWHRVVGAILSSRWLIPKRDFLSFHLAEELGVDPADQITGFSACVFVEGIADIEIFETVAGIFKEARLFPADFRDKNIGFVITGGENLRHWISRRAMTRLNRKFAVVVDSDKVSPQYNIPQRKLNWKASCEREGGQFFITRKRELENYLHKDALIRANKANAIFDQYSDMKKLFGDQVYKVVETMTADEILECDEYRGNGIEHHELKEMVEVLLAMPDRH